MTDSCVICDCEAVDLNGWYLKTKPAHGKIAVIECICPWCVKGILEENGEKNEQS